MLVTLRFLLHIFCFLHVFFCLVSACPWTDAFSSNSPIYQSAVTNERNRCYVQCHGACTESLPLTPWPAYYHHGRVCKGTILRLESRVVYLNFPLLIPYAGDWSVIHFYMMEMHQIVFIKLFTLFCTALLRINIAVI